MINLIMNCNKFLKQNKIIYQITIHFPQFNMKLNKIKKILQKNKSTKYLIILKKIKIVIMIHKLSKGYYFIINSNKNII